MTASSLLRQVRRHIALFGAVLASTMALFATDALAQQDDPFLITSACDAERSRARAKSLFEFVEKQFASFRNTMPLEVKVHEDAWFDNRPPTFTHHAKFATFEATYYLFTGGNRALQSLTTRSASFQLPLGLRMGHSKSRVLRALGPPTAMSQRSLLYQIGGEAIHDVFFTFDDDRLVEVSWAYGQAD